MKNRFLTTAALVLVFGLVQVLAPATTQARKGAGTATTTFEWQGGLSRGQVVEIHGVNGDVRATPAHGGDVMVLATKSGRGDHDAVTIEVMEHAEGVTICAVYPGARSSACQPGANRSSSANNVNVEVDFEIKVPSGVAFIGRSVNGAVKAEGLDAAVTAVTVNGGIDIETSGAATAQTVNGGISAALGEIDREHPSSFETVNGGITLELAPSVSARLKLNTVNGKIRSDFPVDIKKAASWGPKSASGVIGDGDSELKVSTVNGTIRLKSSR